MTYHDAHSMPWFSYFEIGIVYIFQFQYIGIVILESSIYGPGVAFITQWSLQTAIGYWKRFQSFWLTKRVFHHENIIYIYAPSSSTVSCGLFRTKSSKVGNPVLVTQISETEALLEPTPRNLTYTRGTF